MTALESQSLTSKLDAELLAALLKETGVCFTIEEAEAIAEVFVADWEDDDDGNGESDGEVASEITNSITEGLMQYLDIDVVQAEAINAMLQRKCRRSDGSYMDLCPGEEGNDDEDVDPSIASPSQCIETVAIDGATREEEDDGNDLDEGECQLCDRFIRLTRHHLIPRSTWPRIQQRFLEAADYRDCGDEEEARKILGHGLEDRLKQLSVDKARIRKLLHETCDICRPCHTAIHRVHCNIDLALRYNTVDKLLEDQKIFKFCKWASKQKAGRYSVRKHPI